MAAAHRAFPDKIVVSLSICGSLARPPLVFFRVGPCGGCAGIPTIAELQGAATLSVLATITPDEDGTYFGCLPLILTTDGLLYLSCLGEGTAVIRSVEIPTGRVSAILGCLTEGTGRCTPE